jgi:hypothetical protein
MHDMMKKSKWGVLLLGILAALFLAASGAALAAPVSFDLWANVGSTTLPGPATVTVWGYSETNTPPTVPGGPTLIVDQGDVVTVTLHNGLTESTGLLFQGQDVVPDTSGAAPAGTKTYTFTATNPGTFLYESALLPNAQHQTAMGLYGALVVRPAPTARSDTETTVVTGSTNVTDTAILATDLGAAVSGTGIPSGTTITAVVVGASFTMSAAATADVIGTIVVTRYSAYGNSASEYSNEALLVLSEFDPALAANPAGFDMRDYAPKYFLINGKAYPATDPIPSAAGNKILLRYVNAGIQHHSMAVLGLRQNFVAKDASLLPTLNHNVAAEMLAPGQTGDAIATVPATTTNGSRFAVYDGSLMLHNSNTAGLGGMLTFVTVGTGSGATGPVTSNVALSPNPSNGSTDVTLTATITSDATAAEYFVDGVGANGTGCAIAGSPTSVNVAIPVSGGTAPCVDLTTLASGKHTFYVHGTDGTNWGAVASAVLNLDKTGPATTGLTLTPNPSSGSITVALSGTGNDGTTGNNNVTAAEYTVDGGTAVPMTLSGAPAPVRSLTANIPAGLAAGPHAISVRSQDALGNWGAPATIMLNVVGAGPVTSGVSAAKNPNNGALPLNSSQPVVRVTATMTSARSTVGGAEGFIDTPPANVTVRGFSFVPADGVWNGATETGYADIPLATINALSVGNHTIYVRGRDAVGNWGDTATTVLFIDKIAPTFTGMSLSPTTAIVGETVTLTVTGANDTGGAGLSGNQYWIDGTATPPANPTAFTGPSTTFSVPTGGLHTVYVRVGDLAGNWSSVRNATLTVPSAVNNAVTFNANNAVTQTFNQAAPGVLANDLPIGMAGRTATLVSGPVRTAGTGIGTISVTCGAGPATGVCTNGSYRVTLTGVGATGAARAGSKRGTYQFTYTETLNGKTTPPATVTITVN